MFASMFYIREQFKVFKSVVELVLIFVMQHKPFGDQLSSVLPPHQMMLQAVAVVVGLAWVIGGGFYALVEFELGHSTACSTPSVAIATKAY